MSSFSLPIGTRIYLTKKPPYELYLKPDVNILNDSLYLLYDVRISGTTVIPKGTRITGDWITETNPSIAAQLQLNKIYLHGSGQSISGYSAMYETITEYNVNEVNNSNYLYGISSYTSTANIPRRIVKIPCDTRILADNNLNSVYIDIFTKEIPVTLDTVFDYCPC